MYHFVVRVCMPMSILFATELMEDVISLHHLLEGGALSIGICQLPSDQDLTTIDLQQVLNGCWDDIYGLNDFI